jgi:hypothetical protein
VHSQLRLSASFCGGKLVPAKNMAGGNKKRGGLIQEKPKKKPSLVLGFFFTSKAKAYFVFCWSVMRWVCTPLLT